MSVFNIISIPRSGHIAILNWLAGQESCEYVNSGRAIHDEQMGFSAQVGDHSMLICPHRRDGYLDLAHKELIRKHLHPDKTLIIDNQSFDYGRIEKNYQILPENFEIRLDKVYNIVVLRDAFNNLASYMKLTKRYRDRTIENWGKFKENWKTQAREVLNPTFTIPILYNKWKVSSEYRRSICVLLGLRFTDFGFNRVPHNGSGSSFDEMNYDGKASEMNTLKRYEEEEKDGLFLELIDQELVDLTRKVFGMYAPSSTENMNPDWYKERDNNWKTKLKYKLYNWLKK